MIIIPAIDLMDKKVVRLYRGESASKKIYSDKPVEVSLKWKEQKAAWLHIIDLDAAFGKGNNLDRIEEIIGATGINIQVGGGIRSLAYAKKLIKLGVKRIVVSTRAFEDRNFLVELLRELYPSSVAVSVDVKEGELALDGWRKTISLNIVKLFNDLVKIGLQWLVYTDISRDGTLKGANLTEIETLMKKIPINFIASGGVNSLSDIKNINSLGVWGVIVGKALYEGRFTLAEAIGSVQ